MEKPKLTSKKVLKKKNLAILLIVVIFIVLAIMLIPNPTKSFKSMGWSHNQAYLKFSTLPDITIEFEEEIITEKEPVLEHYKFTEASTGELILDIQLQHYDDLGLEYKQQLINSEDQNNSEFSASTSAVELGELELLGNLLDTEVYSIRSDSELYDLYQNQLLFKTTVNEADVDFQNSEIYHLSAKFNPEKQQSVEKIVKNLQ